MQINPYKSLYIHLQNTIHYKRLYIHLQNIIHSHIPANRGGKKEWYEFPKGSSEFTATTKKKKNHVEHICLFSSLLGKSLFQK